MKRDHMKWYITGGILVIVLVSAMLYMYYRHTENSLIDSAFNSVDEVLIQQRQSFVGHTQAAMRELSFASESIALVRNKPPEEIAGLLKTIVEKSIFSKTILASLSGDSISDDGKFINIADREYFIAASNEMEFISDPFVSDIDGERYFAVSMPLYRNRKPAAVFAALIRLDDLSYILHPAYNGDGRAYIITAEGAIVARSANAIIPLDVNMNEFLEDADVLQFDSMSTMNSKIKRQEEGRSDFFLGGKRRLMSYKPIGINGWYAISVVDFKHVAVNIRGEIGSTLILSSGILVIFFFIFFMLMQGYKKLQLSEKNLEQAEEHSRLLLDSVPMGCSLWSEEQECFRSNQHLLDMLMAGEESEISTTLFTLFSPITQKNGRISQEVACRHLEEAFHRGKAQFEWTFLSKNNEEIPAFVTLVRNTYHGKFVVSAFTEDLREKKAAEEALRDMEEYSRLLMKATPIACNLWDDTQRLAYCNDANLKLYGCDSQEEFIEKFDQCSPEYQPCGRKSEEMSYEMVQEALKEGSAKFEWVHRNISTGECFPCEITLIRIKHKTSYIVAGYVRDLREQNAMIEEMEARKKAEIAREEAERSSKTKLQFLAKMSHEIRTPMNAIMGMSDLLLESELNKQQKAYARDIQVSSETLLGIINDILDFSKLESGTIELVCKNYNFYSFLENMESIARHIITSKKLAYSYTSKGDIPAFLYGDPTRLKQILWNIIGNAAKYTREGSVSITVTGLKDTLRFDVVDTGIGLRQENIPKLFDAFSQFDREKNSNVVGTGLGLSIVKSYVELMGGTIEVQSVYGEGSVFSIIIPFITGKAVEEEEHNEDSYKIVGADVSVLVVDDNEINLHVASGLFALLGIYIDTASSGQDSIKMIQDKHYDLVFMDHMMPGMDGIETTHAIRALGSDYVHLPIIALTANAVKGAKEMLIDQGMNDFLSKPIIREELNRILFRWITKDKLTLAKISEQPAVEQVKNPLWERIEEEIPEINVETGLKRAGGSWEGYQTALELYISRAPEYSNKLRSFLEVEDFKSYAIVVHSLKGVFATFGAMGLSNYAANLELAAKSGDHSFCIANNAEFLETLAGINSKLGAIFTTNEDDSQKEACPENLLPEQAQKIVEAIDEFDDSKAIELLDELLGYRHEEEIRNDLRAAKDGLRAFEFDKALEVMEKILKM